jgi:hypothetical protein
MAYQRFKIPESASSLATLATVPALSARSVASVASVAGPHRETSAAVTTSDKARRDPHCELQLDPDARPDDFEVYAEALRLHGPMSYGTAMRMLGWGGTRAGQAEAALREAGRIRYDSTGMGQIVDLENFKKTRNKP